MSFWASEFFQMPKKIPFGFSPFSVFGLDGFALFTRVDGVLGVVPEVCSASFGLN
jgi:hypothetical protein